MQFLLRVDERRFFFHEFSGKVLNFVSGSNLLFLILILISWHVLFISFVKKEGKL